VAIDLGAAARVTTYNAVNLVFAIEANVSSDHLPQQISFPHAALSPNARPGNDLNPACDGCG
jgi:hypothetical protein